MSLTINDKHKISLGSFFQHWGRQVVTQQAVCKSKAGVSVSCFALQELLWVTLVVSIKGRRCREEMQWLRTSQQVCSGSKIMKKKKKNHEEKQL